MASPNLVLYRVNTAKTEISYAYPTDNWSDIDFEIVINDTSLGKNVNSTTLTGNPSSYIVNITPKSGYKLDTSINLSTFKLCSNSVTFVPGASNNITTFTEDKMVIQFVPNYTVYYRGNLFNNFLYLPNIAISASTEHKVSWTCSNSNWSKQVSITPTSPMSVVSGGITMTVQAKDGYHFETTDSVIWRSGLDSGEFTRFSDSVYTFNVDYDDWDDGDSMTISYTITSDSKPSHNVSWTCSNSGWNEQVSITPTSPISIESGDTVVLAVEAKSGYHFETSDGVSWYYGVDSGSFTRVSSSKYTYSLAYDDWDDGDSLKIGYTITKDSTDKSLKWTCTNSDWSKQVSITPTSPITVSKGSSVTIRVTPLDGYYFNDENTVICWVSSIDSLNFVLDSDGSYYYNFTYSEVEDIDDYTMRIVYTITEGEKPTPSSEFPKFYTVYEPSAENMQVINNSIFYGTSGSESVVDYFLSFRKFFCKIPTDGTKQLTASSYKFNTTAKTVKNTIITLDCGKVIYTEKYKSLVDYNPYTTFRIYLPFIGFETIESKYISEYGLGLKYEVNVVSGMCLAKLLCYTSENSYYCFAEYGGSCAVEEPITQGQVNYKGTYELYTTTQLGDLVPILYCYTKEILEGDIANYKGLPTNEVKIVGDCSGYVSFDSVYVTGVYATDYEKSLIESQLLSGILVD